MGINIPIGANASEAIRAARQAGDAIESIGDELDDLKREASRSGKAAGDDLADGIKDGARDAEKATERLGDSIRDDVRDGVRGADTEVKKLEDSFKDAVRASKKETGDLGKDLGTNVKKGTDDAKEGLHEFRDEANSTAKESAASFDGSFESVGDAIQEIAANAFAGFGPAGAVAGLAAAAGIGIVMTKLQDGAEDAERFKARVGELTEELINVGEGTVGIDYIVDKLKEMATATDDAEVSLADLREIADKSGSSYKDLAQAYAGNAEGLDKLIKKTEEQKKALEDKNKAEEVGLTYRDRQGGDDPRIAATEKYIDYLKKAQEAQQEAAEQDANFTESGGRQAEAQIRSVEALAKANEDNRDRAAAATEQYVESIQSATDEAGSAIDEFVTDQGFNLDAYNANMEKSAQAITQYQQNVVAASSYLSEEALAYIRSLGPDAAPALQAFIDAPNDQKQRTAANWNAQGQIASDSFSTKLQNQLNGASFNTRVIVTPDMQRVNDELARKRTISIEARIQNNIASQLPARQGMGVP